MGITYLAAPTPTLPRALCAQGRECWNPSPFHASSSLILAISTRGLNGLAT